jgi:hypothetical protein
MFVFSETHKPALGLNQSPVELVPGARRSGREVNTHSYLVPRLVKNEWS